MSHMTTRNSAKRDKREAAKKATATFLQTKTSAQVVKRLRAIGRRVAKSGFDYRRINMCFSGYPGWCACCEESSDSESCDDGDFCDAFDGLSQAGATVAMVLNGQKPIGREHAINFHGDELQILLSSGLLVTKKTDHYEGHCDYYFCLPATANKTVQEVLDERRAQWQEPEALKLVLPVGLGSRSVRSYLETHLLDASHGSAEENVSYLECAILLGYTLDYTLELLHARNPTELERQARFESTAPQNQVRRTAKRSETVLRVP